MYPIGELWIHTEHEIGLARQWTQKLARLVKLSIGNNARLTTAVSQVTQCVQSYSQSVRVCYQVIEGDGKLWLQVMIREARTPTLSGEQRKEPTLSKEDFLQWLRSIGNLVSQFSILSEEGTPVEIRIAKPFPSWKSHVTQEEVQSWGEALRNEMPQSLLEEILQQNQELAQVLDTLREKELALEQKVAETQKLENLRDDLVHALIHDLRNPLATIRSSLSGLLYNNTENLSAYQFEMIKISYLGTRKMTHLVDNILEMHKLERGGIPMETGRFSLSELVSKVIKAQTPLAREKEIQLSRRIAHDLPPLEGDRRLIERVLQNLTDNALKFTPPGGRITITSKCLIAKGKNDNHPNSLPQETFVSISVKDTGPGIPEPLEANLFDKFTTGLQDESGSGLGLAFCRMAVQAHGGEIWAKNNWGLGTTVTFILPVSLKERI